MSGSCSSSAGGGNGGGTSNTSAEKSDCQRAGDVNISCPQLPETVSLFDSDTSSSTRLLTSGPAVCDEQAPNTVCESAPEVQCDSSGKSPESACVEVQTSKSSTATAAHRNKSISEPLTSKADISIPVTSIGESQMFADLTTPPKTGTSTSEHTFPKDTTDPCLGTYDVGYIIGKANGLSKEEKVKYLKDHFKPGKNYPFISQIVTKGKEGKTKTLTFQPSWLDKYKWLVYSNANPGGFCKYCVITPPKDARIKQTGVLVTTPFTNLSKASGKDGVLEKHQNFQYHKDAVEMGTTMLHTQDNPRETISYMISSQKQEIFEENIHILECIVDAILFCGRQKHPIERAQR